MCTCYCYSQRNCNGSQQMFLISFICDQCFTYGESATKSGRNCVKCLNYFSIGIAVQCWDFFAMVSRQFYSLVDIDSALPQNTFLGSCYFLGRVIISQLITTGGVEELETGRGTILGCQYSPRHRIQLVCGNFREELAYLKSHCY